MRVFRYVDLAGDQKGPVTPAELKAAWDRKDFLPDALCWNADMETWIEAKSVPAAMAIVSPPKPKSIAKGMLQRERARVCFGRFGDTVKANA